MNGTPQPSTQPANAASGLPPDPIRFASFELDRHHGELRKRGLKIRIQDKPLLALLLLIEKSGRIVTRAELQEALWPDEQFGDFEHGVNLAINRLRQALGDRAKNPIFVETVPRRGYRFIYPLDFGPSSTPKSLSFEPSPAAPASKAAPTSPFPKNLPGRRILVALVSVLLLSSFASWVHLRAPGELTTEQRLTAVVLPFRDFSPQPAAYLSHGLTAELIARLGRANPERFGVIALTTALQYEDTARSVDRIARELGVQYVIEGSVSQFEEQIRLHIQVIRAEDQTQVLSESFDSEISSLLETERLASERILASLRSRGLDSVTPVTPGPNETAPHPRAYQALLKGRFFWNQRTETSLQQAAEAFQEAIEIDSDYAPAHAGLAHSFALFPSYGIAMPNDVMPKARSAALRALELDASLAEAHAALALVRWAFEWDHERALTGFRAATERSASYATAHQWLASSLLSTGAFAEARREMHLARELDPLSLIINTGVALVEFYARDYAQAIESCHASLKLQPYFPYGQELLALAYAHHGDHEQAIRWLERRLEVESTPAVLASSAYIYALTDRRQQARAILEQLMTSAETGDYVPPYRVALVYTALEENDQAFRWLRTALEGRAFEMTLLKVDPRLDPLRHTLRFRNLLEEIWPNSGSFIVTTPAEQNARRAIPAAGP